MIKKEEYQSPEVVVYEMETEGILAASGQVTVPPFAGEEW